MQIQYMNVHLRIVWERRYRKVVVYLRVQDERSIECQERSAGWLWVSGGFSITSDNKMGFLEVGALLLEPLIS